jgi:putative hydrolase of the HAD superfamily
VSLDAVLLDLDDTILEYRRSPADLLAASFDAEGVDHLFEVDAYYDRYDEFRDRHEDVDDLRAACFAALAADRGADPDLGRRVAETYAAMRDHRDVRFRPGAETALAALRGRDLRVGLVTNGARSMQVHKLEALGLEDAFETVVYAGESVPAKPDPEPFRVALSALDVTADRTMHVGNSVESDVAGAHAAGIRSVWVPGADYDRRRRAVLDIDPHHELDTLSDLPALVDEVANGRVDSVGHGRPAGESKAPDS